MAACAAALVVAAALVGCASAPPAEPLPLEDAPALSQTDGRAVADRWWQDFDDPQLSAAVETALTDSFTLRQAAARLWAAQAIAAQTRSARSPTLDAFVDAGRTDGRNVDGQGDVGLGLSASYEVDLWGRIRADVDAARLEADATAEDHQTAALTLSAEIAQTLYQRVEASAQRALVDAQLATNRDVLEVIESRFAIGQSGATDVLRQRQLVEATVEQQILAAARVARLDHRLAVLLGRPPQADAAIDVPMALPALAMPPAVGLPSDLLQRRPDVRAAFLRLAAADASVASAVKDRYPTLRLGAAFSTAAERPSDLFGAWIGSLTGQLLAPLLDGDRRRQEVVRADAVRAERLAAYGDVVLVAFQEVEDALVGEREQIDRIASLDAQFALAETTYAELRNQYLNGAADFIDVLVALRDQQGLERERLTAQLLRVEQRIDLHRAVAGGFLDPDRAPAVITPTTEGQP
ncbi:MAG: TolC family protein [Acidobacteriota bacterium]